MSEDLMKDKSQPAPEAGTVSNVLTRQQMRATVVRISFKRNKRGIRADVPEQTPRFVRFGTTVLAQEFIERVNPRVELGSPKQAEARRAKLVKLQQHLMKFYDIDLVVVSQADISTVNEHGGTEVGGPDADDEILDTFTDPTTTGDEDETEEPEEFSTDGK